MSHWTFGWISSNGLCLNVGGRQWSTDNVWYCWGHTCSYQWRIRCSSRSRGTRRCYLSISWCSGIHEYFLRVSIIWGFGVRRTVAATNGACYEVKVCYLTGYPNQVAYPGKVEARCLYLCGACQQSDLWVKLFFYCLWNSKVVRLGRTSRVLKDSHTQSGTVML